MTTAVKTETVFVRFIRRPSNQRVVVRREFESAEQITQFLNTLATAGAHGVAVVNEKELTLQPPDVYEWTGPTGVEFVEVRDNASGLYYHSDTPKPVIRGINRAYRERVRIRFHLGDQETGRDWMEEHDVCGRVGASTGWVKTPLLLKSSNSSGGPAISTSSIIRLCVDGLEYWKHPKWTKPELKVAHTYVNVPPHWKHEVVAAAGEIIARFKSTEEALRFVSFIQGDRMAR